MVNKPENKTITKTKKSFDNHESRKNNWSEPPRRTDSKKNQKFRNRCSILGCFVSIVFCFTILTRNGRQSFSNAIN